MSGQSNDSVSAEHANDSASAEQASQQMQQLARSVASVMRGQERSIRLLLSALAAGSHALLEDVPGTGKTTLAKALARSIGGRFRRIQFTPDLLPTDILGVSIFNPRDQSFRFHEGPIFANVLLADEINRASPRTQSALLEAMAEGQVTVDNETHRLRDLFFVIATQNPVEQQGTYPLPEAQMDRFATRFAPGYVSIDEEVAILAAQQQTHPLDSLESCLSVEDVRGIQSAAANVHLTDELRRYIVDLVRATRSAEGVSLGASPRASLALMRMAQGVALLDGRPMVTPDHVREMAPNVIAHRLSLDPQAKFSGTTAEAIVADVLAQVPPPI